jgi:hypothetical protein
LDYCDNRNGIGELICEGKSIIGSNKAKWETDGFMNALSGLKGFRSTFDYVMSYYNEKAGNVIGSELTENPVSRKNVQSSISTIYKEVVPAYSISRIYEKVQTCGNIQVTSEKPILLTVTSTTYCKATDSWEYLNMQDCDNRDDQSKHKQCALNLTFGVEVKGYKSSLLHRLGLDSSQLLDGLDDNFFYNLSPSPVTAQYWSEVNSSVWQFKTDVMINVSSRATYNTKYYQLCGECSEFKIYTNVIKPVQIPGLNFCTPYEKFLLVGEEEVYQLPNGAVLNINEKKYLERNLQHYVTQANYVSPNITYTFSLHPIGVDFPTREIDTTGLQLFLDYYNLVEEFRNKFLNLSSGTALNKSEIFWKYARLNDSCPWVLIGDACGRAEHLVRPRNSSEPGIFTAHQLVGKCGDVSLYTDYVIHTINGVVVKNISDTIQNNECLIEKWDILTCITDSLPKE